MDFCWTWLYAAVRLPFVLTARLLRFVQRVFIRWYDAIAFIVGMPTFWERDVLGRAVDLRDEHLKNADAVIAGYIKNVRHLEVLNKALAKNGHSQAAQIRELEATLADERRKYDELSDRYERLFR